MGFHTFPIERADELEDPWRYRFCSREELIEMLGPSPDDRVADLGSGTGFYTAEVAPFVGTVYAIDLQVDMHRRHRRQRLPPNTRLITGDVPSLPLVDDSLDLAFSVDTHHEYAEERAMAELARTIRPGGRLVTVDWSGTGSGEEGPPLDERFHPSDIADQVEGAGFSVQTIRDRPETVAVVAQR